MSKHKGLEILLVIVAVVVLAGLLLSMVARSKQYAIRTCCCPSNLQQLGLALKEYCVSGASNYPPVLSGLSPDWVAPKLFQCPGDRGSPVASQVSNVDEITSYIYVAGLNPHSPKDVPLMICPPINHEGDGGIVMFCDYETRWIRCPKIDKLIDWTYTYAESNGLRVVVSERLEKRSGGRYKSYPRKAVGG